MSNQEDYRKQAYWRCRCCGYCTPIGKPVCGNPNCGVELSVFGEMCSPDPDQDSTGESRVWEETDGSDKGKKTSDETRAERKARKKAEAAEKRRARKQRKAEAKQSRKAARAAKRRGSSERRGTNRETVRRSTGDLYQMPVWVFALLTAAILVIPRALFTGQIKLWYISGSWTFIYSAAAVLLAVSFCLLLLTIRRWTRKPRFSNVFFRICSIILLLCLFALPVLSLWHRFLGIYPFMLAALIEAVLLFALTKKDPVVPAFLFLGVSLWLLAIYGPITTYLM